ncbi:pyruvate kinase alpha/beta domain-containing protein [Neokomagataea anthophila]|nr:pyruvate kinase alpha/beta domain-containing protein [Neokomagataea anthophila]
MAVRAAELALSNGFCVKGDHVLVLAGLPYGLSGSTNTLRVIKA